MLRSDEYGNSYDDGQPDPNAADPSQRYITTYTNDEFGNYSPQQVENPNYDVQRYDPEEYQRRVDYANTQTSKRGGVFGVLDKIGGWIDDKKIPLALAAGAAFGGPALASYLSAGGIGAGTTAASALGELGINTALAAGAPGGIAAGTTIGGLAGYTPELLHAASSGGLPSLSNIIKPAVSLARSLSGGSGSSGGGGGVGGISGLMGSYGGGAQAPGVQVYNPTGNYANPYEDASPVNTRPTRDYSTPMQMSKNLDDGEEPELFAAGGIAGLGMRGMAPIEYKAGGKYLSGPGDGMSDNIKANIEGKQEARLADGEFVIPADVVSHIGNGSSNAGAKKLYAMMDKIRKARTGNHKQGKQIKAEKFLPA